MNRARGRGACVLAFFLRTNVRHFSLPWRSPAITSFIAYARAPWDGLPAASLMCAVLYCSASLLRGIEPGQHSVMLAEDPRVADP
jgi:hypothetical protein